MRTDDYDKDIHPFIKNGIIIDTCVIKTLIDGFIATRITKKRSEDMEDFQMALAFLDRIKVGNNWGKFFVTPHILTEVFQHFRKDYCDWKNYPEVLKEVMPFIESMGEENAKKLNILQYIDSNNPVIEMGDISIFVITDNFINDDKKVAILSADGDLTDRFTDNNKVLAMNYRRIMLNYN